MSIIVFLFCAPALSYPNCGSPCGLSIRAIDPSYTSQKLKEAVSFESGGEYLTAVSTYLGLGEMVEAKRVVHECQSRMAGGNGALPPGIVVTLSQGSDVKALAAKVADVLPLLLVTKSDVRFDLASSESCYGMCAAYSVYLAILLQAVEIPVELYTSENGHVSLRHGDLIIDPSIKQFVRHGSMTGVFVGTRADLIDFILQNPNSIINTSSQGKPIEALRRLWGITVVH